MSNIEATRKALVDAIENMISVTEAQTDSRVKGWSSYWQGVLEDVQDTATGKCDATGVSDALRSVVINAPYPELLSQDMYEAWGTVQGCHGQWGASVYARIPPRTRRAGSEESRPPTSQNNESMATKSTQT